MYEEERSKSWPGLAREGSEICEIIGISDVNEMSTTKSDIKSAIFNHHYSDMIEEIKTKSKLDAIKDNDFTEAQEYLKDKSIDNSRMAFKVRSQMLSDIPGNFKNKYRVRGTTSDGLICEYCQEEEIMTQSHCLTCTAWSGLREGLDLDNITDLVVFFRRMMKERERVSEETALHDSGSGSSRD